jgi:hypothetical protein
MAGVSKYTGSFHPWNWQNFMSIAWFSRQLLVDPIQAKAFGPFLLLISEIFSAAI